MHIYIYNKDFHAIIIYLKILFKFLCYVLLYYKKLFNLICLFFNHVVNAQPSKATAHAREHGPWRVCKGGEASCENAAIGRNVK